MIFGADHQSNTLPFLAKGESMMIKLTYVLWIYLVIINLYGLILMYRDKQHSIKHEWRVPEARFFTIALLFGSPGIFAGMYLFRHKTRHLRFVLGVPVLILLQIYLLVRCLIFFTQ